MSATVIEETYSAWANAGLRAPNSDKPSDIALLNPHHLESDSE